MGVKGLSGAGLAYGLGAPLGAAAKFGISSAMAPLGVLTGMAKVAGGALQDLSVAEDMGDYGLSTKAKKELGVNEFDDMAWGDIEAALATGRMSPEEAAQLGVVDAAQQMDMENERREMGLFESLQDMYKGLKSIDFDKSTNIDPVTGLHKGQLSNDPMGVSKAMGLQSSFGSIGDGGGFGGGSSGNSGGFGDRESSGGYGGMGGI